jgi:hypothetical protein
MNQPKSPLSEPTADLDQLEATGVVADLQLHRFEAGGGVDADRNGDQLAGFAAGVDRNIDAAGRGRRS